MREKRPFRVYKGGTGWFLARRHWPFTHIGVFATPGEAIDYAHKNWPWWP